MDPSEIKVGTSTKKSPILIDKEELERTTKPGAMTKGKTFISKSKEASHDYQKLIKAIDLHQSDSTLCDSYLSKFTKGHEQPHEEIEFIAEYDNSNFVPDRNDENDLTDTPGIKRLCCSPNGRYLLALQKLTGQLLVFDLKSLNTTSNSNSAHRSNTYLSEQIDLTNYFPGGIYTGLFRDNSESGLSLCFFPDSSGFVVASKSEVYMYSLGGGVENIGERIERVWMNPDSQVRFIYFNKPTFGADRYKILDHHQLVIGHDKGISVTYFQLDNFQWALNEPFPKHKTLELANFDYTHTLITELKDATFHHNSSDTIVAVKTNAKGKRTLFVFRFDPHDFDVEHSFKFKLKDQLELSASLKPFFKTISSSGEFFFCYNSKKGEILEVTLEENPKFETVMKLTGKRRNLKHLAVKEDGKYLLIVDSSFTAEVWVKGNKEYFLLTSFSVKSNQSLRSKEDPLGINREKAQDTEHDLSDMDFLEDGSGIIFYRMLGVNIKNLNLPSPPENYSLVLNCHYHDAVFVKYWNGRYVFNQGLPKLKKYQKTIDFDSEIKVRTIKNNTPDQSDFDENIFDIDFIHGSLIEKANLRTPGYGSYAERMMQLFSLIDEKSDSLSKIEIPNCQKIIYWYEIYDPKKGLILCIIWCFSEKDEDGQTLNIPKLCWKAEVDRLKDGWFLNQQRTHCNFFFDNQGKYLVVPHETYARVLSLEDGTEVARIPEGYAFNFITPTRILVTLIDEKAIAGMLHDLESFDNGHKIFDLTTKEFLDLPPSAFERKNKNCGYQMAYSTDERYKVLLGDACIGVYDTVENKYAYEAGAKPSEAIIPNTQYESHMCLVSPNNKWMVTATVQESDIVTIYSLPELKKFTFTLKNRVDLQNRWCFSEDSRFLLIRNNDHIQVFLPSQNKLLTTIPLDNEIAKIAKILYLHVRNNSTELEIVAGYKNKIFFKRVPLYPKEEDLFLLTIGEKLNEYANQVNDKDKLPIAETIGNIMSLQPQYQRYLNSTYLQILCLFNHRTCTNSYLKHLDNKDVLFKYSPYANLIDHKSGFKSSSVYSFIECMEETIITEKRFPPVDQSTILKWLESDEIQTKYKRKLINMITLEPLHMTINGELKDEFISVCHIDKKFSRSSQWLDDLRKHLFKKNSPNSTSYDCFRTAVDFDLHMGSQFSLEYFQWIENVSDDELKQIYMPLIYYKWSETFWPAMTYSMIYWSLNILFCAFMGFTYKTMAVGIIIMALNLFFIIFEFKCLFTKGNAFKDPWNYYDLIIHMYSIACVISILTVDEDSLDYKYNWLRVTSFVAISIRGLTMLRIFRGTRYLITMLFAVFYEMVAFLSVYGYMIFIYWFICVVRPSLKPDGEDETLYSSMQQAFDIAFSNFSADSDYTIGLVTTIIGQIVLGLVLLNYLIAIVSKTYERVAQDRDLHDAKMLLGIIREFDCFFYGIRSTNKKSNMKRYYIVMPQIELSQNLKEIKSVIEDEKKKTEAEIDLKTETKIDALAEQVASLQEKLDTFLKRCDTTTPAIGGYMSSKSPQRVISPQRVVSPTAHHHAVPDEIVDATEGKGVEENDEQDDNSNISSIMEFADGETYEVIEGLKEQNTYEVNEADQKVEDQDKEVLVVKKEDDMEYCPV